jgi:hypothetical protein
MRMSPDKDAGRGKHLAELYTAIQWLNARLVKVPVSGRKKHASHMVRRFQ